MPRMVNFTDPRGGRLWKPPGAGGGGGAVPDINVLSSTGGSPFNGLTQVVSLPADRAIGDVAVVFIAASSLYSESLNDVAGWTKLANVGPATLRTACYYRILDGSASDAITVECTGSSRWGYTAYALRNVATTGTFIAGGVASGKTGPAVDGAWGPSGSVFLNALPQEGTLGVHTPPDTYGNRIRGDGDTAYDTGYPQVESAHKITAEAADTPGAWVYDSGQAGKNHSAFSVAVKAA